MTFISLLSLKYYFNHYKIRQNRSFVTVVFKLGTQESFLINFLFIQVSFVIFLIQKTYKKQTSSEMKETVSNQLQS